MILENDKKPYIKVLQETIEQLNDGFDIQALEMQLLQSEMQETTKPNVLLMQLVQFVLQMMIELNEYEQKNKLTPRMKASKERLIKMLDITSELSGLGDKMNSLKLSNNFMVGKINLLRVENSKLKAELQKIALSETF